MIQGVELIPLAVREQVAHSRVFDHLTADIYSGRSALPDHVCGVGNLASFVCSDGMCIMGALAFALIGADQLNALYCPGHMVRWTGLWKGPNRKRAVALLVSGIGMQQGDTETMSMKQAAALVVTLMRNNDNGGLNTAEKVRAALLPAENGMVGR